MSPTTQVAIVTGGASGIGLATVEKLVQRGWKVTILDKQRAAGEEAAARLGDQVTFFETDVISYEQQAQAFAATWAKWSRLDLVFANAGIPDRQDFIEPTEADATGAPPKPDTVTLDVCLLGAIWSSYLALHFFRRNATPAGSLVMTSSIAGLYAAPGVSVYGAAKYGVIGLTRSLAHRLQKRGEASITVNAICPAFVPTPLINPDLVKRVPKEYLTPYETLVRAVEIFVDERNRTGEVAEVSGEHIYYRPVYEFTNEGSKWVMSGGMKTLLLPGEEQAVRR